MTACCVGMNALPWLDCMPSATHSVEERPHGSWGIKESAHGWTCQREQVPSRHAARVVELKEVRFHACATHAPATICQSHSGLASNRRHRQINEIYSKHLFTLAPQLNAPCHTTIHPAFIRETTFFRFFLATFVVHWKCADYNLHSRPHS